MCHNSHKVSKNRFSKNFLYIWQVASELMHFCCCRLRKWWNYAFIIFLQILTNVFANHFSQNLIWLFSTIKSQYSTCLINSYIIVDEIFCNVLNIFIMTLALLSSYWCNMILEMQSLWILHPPPQKLPFFLDLLYKQHPISSSFLMWHRVAVRTICYFLTSVGWQNNDIATL